MIVILLYLHIFKYFLFPLACLYYMLQYPICQQQYNKKLHK
nr:MAG TPA: hypothetical protein [Caudoviricetes sp.]